MNLNSGAFVSLTRKMNMKDRNPGISCTNKNVGGAEAEEDARGGEEQGGRGAHGSRQEDLDLIRDT